MLTFFERRAIINESLEAIQKLLSHRFNYKILKKDLKKVKKVLDKSDKMRYNKRVLNCFGEVSEWFKEPVLKTGDSERDRGFESHLLR